MKNALSRLLSIVLVSIVLLGLAFSYSFQLPKSDLAQSHKSNFGNHKTVPFNPIEDEKLQVSGRVKNDKGQNLDSILVVISDSTGRINIDTIITDKKGKYKFELEYNQEYRIYYIAKGYIKSYDLFKTEVPNSKLGKQLYAPTMEPILFKENADVNKRAIERHPLYVVYFDKSIDMFNFDVEKVTAFLDEIIKPNVGEMYVSGVFKDTLIDTFRVRIVAEDTLGFMLAETEASPDGSYTIAVPLMNKIKLKFISEDHYESYAIVNSKIEPESKSGDDFNVKQDFSLVNKVDTTVNEEAFNKPIARIEQLEETDQFVANPAVEKHFENELLVGHKRIALTGLLTTTDAVPLKGTMVSVMDGDVLVEEVECDSNSYSVNLPYQSIVHVRFRTNGYHDFFVSYNTNIDFDEMDNMTKMNSNVNLIARDRSDINPMAFKYPMEKYYYDTDAKTFKNDSSISAEFIAMLNSPPPPPDTAITKTFVTMTGIVKDPSPGGKKIPEARIRVLNEDRILISSYNADKKGRYDVTLGLNKIYYLEVEQDGFLATQIKVDTKVPAGVEKFDLEDQYGYDLEILSPDMEIVNPEDGKKYKMRQEMLEQNAAMAYVYNPETKEFEEDPQVADSFAEAIIAYKEPVEEEIPAVTVAQLEEAKRLEAEKNKPKVPELRLAGKVVDERGKALSGSTITLLDGKKKVGEAKTDSLGNYNMELPAKKNLVMKIEGENLHTVTAAVNTTYPDSVEPKNDIITMPDLKTYTTSNIGINPAAFNGNWQSVAYDATSNRFKRNEETPLLYAKKLNSTPDNQYLLVEGRAKDQKGRSISDAKILLSLNGKVIDTLITDKKGKYEMKLDYQKDYRIQVIKESYESTFASVSTNTSKKTERLIDKKIKGFNLLLVNKNEENINKKVFSKPYARVAYDADLDEFVEVNSVTNNFLADMYIPIPKEEKKDKRKQEYQLTASTVAAPMTLVNSSGTKEYTTPAGASQAAAKKRSQNKNQGKKSEIMKDFHNAMYGRQSNKKINIQNVTLSLNEIFNARPIFNGQDKKEMDASIAEAAEQKNDFNDIISSALGMRTDADLVSTDSTFNVNLIPRLKHIDQGAKIYTISRDQVFVNGVMTEYVETTDWFFWHTRYKNNKVISKKTYYNELDSIKTVSSMLN